jgi:pimeloyl-ACP methyl ester carboxylesterase
MSKPVIVLVPGSFAKAYFYSGVADKLSEYGYETDTVELPSCGRRDPAPAATMADDAAAIQSVTRKYIDQGKTVLVCTHSYGGIPGTESIKGLATTTRKSNGLKGGVSRIVYVTSVVVPVGQSIKDGMGDNLPDYLIVDVSCCSGPLMNDLLIVVPGRLHAS